MGDAKGAARQPAYVLCAWIKDLLREIRAERLARLQQLRVRLHGATFDWDNAQLARAVLDMHAAGRDLHFLPLRQGLIARLLGRHRAAQARFMALHQRIADCASQVKAQREELVAAGDRERAAAARRVLLEIDMERQALHTGIEQAVTWLQDMCMQLADARASGEGDQELESLAEAAQLFTQELKRLEGIVSTAQDIRLRGNTVFDRRVALLEQVCGDLESFGKHWSPRVALLVADLQAGGNGFAAIPKAIEAHDDLMKRLSATVDACGALQGEENLMAQHLGMLDEELVDPRH
jgi:hypothetical protein